MAYAAGSVIESFSLLIAAHLEQCRTCDSALADAERFAGNLLSELPPAAMNESSLSQVLQTVAETGQVPAERPGYPRDNGLPVVLSKILPEGLSAVRWRPLVPGVAQYRLNAVESGAGSIRLLRIAPGVVIPEHTHEGTELTLILSGSYSDESGRFAAGDLADLDDTVHHRPMVDSSQPCICLVATDQPLRFSSALNRMIQPLLGI